MDNLIIKIIAKLNKKLSEHSLDGDLKSLDNKMHVKVLARLSKALASRELERQLRELNSLSVHIGTDINPNNDLERQLQQTIRSLQQTVSDLKIGLQFPEDNPDIDAAQNSLQNLAENVKELFSSADIVGFVFQQVKEAVHTTLELDKAYTELAKAQEQLNRSDYSFYLEKCNKKAQELATTQKTLLDNITSFSDSGYSLPTSEALAEKSTVLAKIANMDPSDSAAAITSGIQSYDTVSGYTEETNKAQALIDKYSAVANIADITTSEIARGVQIAGSAFADANTGVDEFIALLSAGNRLYQNADVLAKGLSTAALRIHGCTAELEEMGEETGNVYTSAAMLEDRVKQLTDIGSNDGVKILEADGETFRNLYDIFLDISKVYDQMSATDASELLELIAGNHHAPAIEATLTNMPEAQNILQDSFLTDGSAQEEYNTYLQSTEAHIQQFQSKLVEVYSTFMDGSMISHAADLGTAVLDIVTKTDLLKHSLISIAALKIGQGIAQIGGVITTTASQMNTLGNAIHMVKALPVGGNNRKNALDAIGQSTKSLTDRNLKLLLSQSQLDTNDKIAILTQHELTEAQARAKLESLGLTQATNQNSASNAANAASVGTLRGTFTGLRASIQATWAAMSALQKASIIFAAVSTGWSLVSSAISRHNQAEEEAIQATKESANNYKESSSSITDYTKRYAELQQALQAAKGNEEETYNVKRQLLELQTEINEKYGDEYDKLNLVTDAYKDQTDAIKGLNKESANRFLNENVEGINIAKRKMESENTYDLSYAVAKTEVNEKTLTEIVDKYKDSGMSIVDAGESFYIKLKANPQEAYDVINDFQTDVKEAAKSLGNELLFDNTVLNLSSDSLNKAKDSLDKHQEIYEQAQMAEIATDENLSDGYNEVVSAVEAYNEAILKSEEPFSDENVKTTWNNLQTVKQGIQENEAEWGQYSRIMDDVFAAANDSTYAFSQAMQKDNTMSGLANNLKGMSDTDLQAMANDGSNGDSFDKLSDKALEYGLEIQDLINLLVTLGYVQGEIYRKDPLSFTQAWDALSDTEDESLKTTKDDLLALAQAGELTIESFNSTQGAGAFLSQLGIEPDDTARVQEVIDNINALVSSSEQLAAMKKAFSGLSENLQTKQQEPGKAISSETLAGMDEGLKAQTSEWEHYQAVLGNAGSSMEEVQEATNRLANAFLNSNNFLANLTESEKGYYISQLQSMGVANAEELVQESLAEKYELNRLRTEALKFTKDGVTEATYAQVSAFLMEQGASNGVTQAIMTAVEAERIFSSKGLDVTAKLSALGSLISMSYGAAAAMEFATLTGGYDDRGFKKTDGMSDEEAAQAIFDKYSIPMNITMDLPSIPQNIKSGGAPAKENVTKVKETFDFIEIALSRIESAIAKVKTKAEDTFLSFYARGKNYHKTLSKITNEINMQNKAYDRYMQEANNIGLDEVWISRIKDGTLDLFTIEDDEVKQGIRDYQKYYESAEKCKDKAEELKRTQKELTQAKIELLITKYDKLFSKLDSKNNQIKNRIDLKEAWGFSASKGDYANMNKNIRSQIGNIKKQNTELNKLKKTVTKTSEKWYEYDERMRSNNDTMYNLKKTMAENAKAAAALAKAKADKKIAAYDSEDELYDAKADNATKAETKNTLIDKKISNIGKRQSSYKTAVKTDRNNFNTAKRKLNNYKKTKSNKTILKEIQKSTKSGKPIGEKTLSKAAKLNDNGKLYQACLTYNEHLEAYNSDKAIADLYAQTSKQEKADLAMDKFHNIASEYDYGLSENEQKKTQLNSKISLAEEKGQRVNLAYYKGLLSAEDASQKKLIAKRDALQKSLNEAVANGQIVKGSDEWYSMVELINDTTNAIDESILAIAELNKTIRQAKWDLFDSSLATIKRINSETDFFLSLMEKNHDLVDKDTGDFTEFGNAALGLYKADYETSLAEAKAYAKEYADIMKKISTGELSQSDEAVINRLRELQDEEWAAKLAAEDTLNSIISLVRNGYEAQLDALSKLIQKYKDLKQSEKDAYEYQKTIAEKTKNIASLQKQLHAYGGNDTEEARAKIQELKVQLEDARQDLKETEYEKYLSDTNDMLDSLYDGFEAFIDEKLNNTDAILEMINQSVSGMSKEIVSTLTSLNGGISSGLSDLLMGVIGSAEYVSRVITNDKNAQESSLRQAQMQEEANRNAQKAAAENKKRQELEGNARAAQIQKTEATKKISAEEKSISQAKKRLQKIAEEEKKQKAQLAAYNKAKKGGNQKNGPSKLAAVSLPPQKDFTAEKKRLNSQIKSSENAIKSYQKQLNSANAAINEYETYKQASPLSQIPVLQTDMEIVRVSQESSVSPAPVSAEDAEHAEIVKKLIAFSKMPSEEIRSLLHIDPQPTSPAAAITPDIKRISQTGDINVSIDELNLPNVRNYEEFKAALIRDNKFERAIQSMTIDRTVGGNSMAKYKHI